MSHKANSEHVKEGIKADSGQGTATALANAADEAGVDLHLIEQGTSTVTGRKQIRIWTANTTDTDQHKPLPDEIHDLITGWGYEAGKLDADHNEPREQHVYNK